MTRNAAIGILLTINLVLIVLLAAPDTTEQIAHIEVTRTVHVDTLTGDQLLDILRNVNGIQPDGPTDLDYQCWLTLRQYDTTDAAIAAHYIANKWQGDTCAALHHHLEHGWH